MKKTFFAILFFAISIITNAQQVGPNISWDETVFNFGDVKEEGGNVFHKFTFTNTGNAPLVITNVRPSCGCTSSDYTKQPIIPGGKGYVSVSFDPRHRVGKNSKSVTITTNSTPPTSYLRFTVNVIAKPRTIEDDYPRTIGDLRLKTNHLAFMNIYNKDIKDGSIDIINTKNYDLTISFVNVPSHIQIKAEPQVLKPHSKGKIIATYNANKKNDYGFVIDRVVLSINGNTNNNRNKISISANIKEDFSKLSKEELEKAPNISFEDKIFDFGTINRGDVIEHVFKFTNTGKSDLIIRKTKASCGCTVVNPSKNIIKPGETAELKVKFNSAGKRNKQNKSITVITNSPNNAQVVLRVTGFVNTPSNK